MDSPARYVSHNYERFAGPLYTLRAQPRHHASDRNRCFFDSILVTMTLVACQFRGTRNATRHLLLRWILQDDKAPANHTSLGSAVEQSSHQNQRASRLSHVVQHGP